MTQRVRQLLLERVCASIVSIVSHGVGMPCSAGERSRQEKERKVGILKA